MAHQTSPRHIAIGIETTHKSVNMTSQNGTIDLHVDVTELNSVLKGIREMSSGHTQPNVYPHKYNDNTVAIRLR